MDQVTNFDQMSMLNIGCVSHRSVLSKFRMFSSVFIMSCCVLATQCGLVGRWLNPGRDTIGALDLGGASTQITFETSATLENSDNSMKLKLYGKSYKIYTQSFLCYGQDQFLKKLTAHLIMVLVKKKLWPIRALVCCSCSRGIEHLILKKSTVILSNNALHRLSLNQTKKVTVHIETDLVNHLLASVWTERNITSNVPMCPWLLF